MASPDCYRKIDVFKSEKLMCSSCAPSPGQRHIAHSSRLGPGLGAACLLGSGNDCPRTISGDGHSIAAFSRHDKSLVVWWRERLLVYPNTFPTLLNTLQSYSFLGAGAWEELCHTCDRRRHQNSHAAAVTRHARAHARALSRRVRGSCAGLLAQRRKEGL